MRVEIRDIGVPTLQSAVELQPSQAGPAFHATFRALDGGRGNVPLVEDGPVARKEGPEEEGVSADLSPGGGNRASGEDEDLAVDGENPVGEQEMPQGASAPDPGEGAGGAHGFRFPRGTRGPDRSPPLHAGL